MAAAIGTAALFLAVQLGALALVQPFEAAGYQAVEDPSDPTNSVVYLVAILVVTAIVLGALRFGADRLLRMVIAGMSGFLAMYVFSVIAPRVVPPSVAVWLSWALAAGIAVALYAYPEWYVIDTAGVLIGAGAAGLFGISFGPLPALVLLGTLAAYDAVSVYRTGHMLQLAEGVADLKLPLVLVIPLSLDYSYLADVELPGEGEREAFFVGLGDAVMPSVMVASAAAFSSTPELIEGLAINLPALCAMAGTGLGLAALLWLVEKGRAHAGLPLLNGGAIGGYLVGSVLAGVPLVDAVGIAPYL